MEKYVREHQGIGREKYYECHEAKLQNFKVFYDSFFEEKKQFCVNNTIIDVVEMDEINAVVFGINTVYGESYLDVDHIGYINISALRNELDAFESKYDSKFKMAVLHHNASEIGNVKNLIKNWDDVKVIFRNHNINTVFAGTHI